MMSTKQLSNIGLGNPDETNDHFERCKVKVELKNLQSFSDQNMKEVKITDYNTYF